MPNMNIPGVNGTIIANAHTTSSFYKNNGLGKFTDKNMIESVLQAKPEKYDRQMIRLFANTRLYKNDLLNIVMKTEEPLYVNDINGIFNYDIDVIAQAPKIIVTTESSNAGRDGSIFYLVFDKDVFSVNDIITAHRYEQETQVQIVSEEGRFQNGFKYGCTAVGETRDDYVDPQYLVVGAEYIKVGNVLGEYSTSFTGIGLINDKLSVTADVLNQFGIEHTITDWAQAQSLGVKNDRDGNPLDVTYYTVTEPGENGSKSKIRLIGWENTVTSLMRAEMLRMKANMLMYGRKGNTVDEKGRVGRFKSGLWQQLHLGNVVYFTQSQFSINMLRSVISDLLYNKVEYSDRRIEILTNCAGRELFELHVQKDFNKNNFTLNAEKFLDGKDRLSQGYAIGFDHFVTKETGLVTINEVQQLNQADTFMELGTNKKVKPIFIILDVSNQKGSGIREVKFKARPNMSYHYIGGTVGFGPNQMNASSRNPYSEYIMKDWTGIFLEDPTKSVILKTY